MKIAKLFEFENAHIVRDCSSKRCRSSIHGHSYKLELILHASGLDRAAMVYDFGLLKREIKQIIDAFDHSTCLWAQDDERYIADIKRHSERWILLPFNVSAEMLAMLFFTLIEALLRTTSMQNGENDVRVWAVKLNETRTGWAMAEQNDCIGAQNELLLDISQLEFSKAIIDDFERKDLLEIIKISAAGCGVNGDESARKFITNPKSC